MSRAAVVALRVSTVIIFAGLLLAQAVLLPLAGASVVAGAPEVSGLRWVILVMAIVTVGTVQVALACLWRLLTMVQRGTVFSTDALRFVDVIVGAIVAATVLVTAMNVVLTNGQANPPLVFLTLTAGTIGGVGLALLMVVMRALLAQATTLRHELSEVV